MEQPDKGTVRDLVYYRIETAKNDIRVADILLSEKNTGQQITGRITQFSMQ